MLQLPRQSIRRSEMLTMKKFIVSMNGFVVMDVPRMDLKIRIVPMKLMKN